MQYIKNQKKSLDDYNGDISHNNLWGHPKNTFLVMHTVEAKFVRIKHFFLLTVYFYVINVQLLKIIEKMMIGT